MTSSPSRNTLEVDQQPREERGVKSKEENSLSTNVLIKAQGHNFTFEAKVNVTKLSRNMINREDQKSKRPTTRPITKPWSSDSCRGMYIA